MNQIDKATIDVNNIKKTIGAIIPRWFKRQLYRRLAGDYIKGLDIVPDKSKKSVVVFNHYFDQDVRALELANKDFNLIIIDTVTLFRGAKIFFEEKIRELHAPYINAEPQMLAEYSEECQLILNQLKKQTGVDIIVTPSDIFYWVREFIAVAKKSGVETVVLDKEGTISPHDFYIEAERVKVNAPFMSKRIFVWSERQHEFWTRIGANENQISIIGQPRSDLLHHEKRIDVDKLFEKPQPLVTFFSYMDDAYIPVELVLSEKLKWEMKGPTHDEIYRLACKHTEYNFVVKTHPQQQDLKELQSRYNRENLKVVGGSAIANELLQRSELIIAFQTTGIIEGMLLGKNIIYTNWDSLIDRLKDDLLPFHEAEGIRVLRSFDEFKNVCSAFLDGDKSAFEFTKEQQKARDQFVNRYFYQPDGNVCERFFSEIKEMLV